MCPYWMAKTPQTIMFPRGSHGLQIKDGPIMAKSPRADSYYSKSIHEPGIDAKIVLMGNTGVGKTSLLQRYTQNKFEPKNSTSTTAASFLTKKVYVSGMKVRLQLWDTAGQERFRSMAPMYYRGANAALILYDITNISTFEDVRGWVEELRKTCAPDLIVYLVGAKADLHRHRQVTSDLVRLSLYTWFPPPRPQTPPPTRQSSKLPYIPIRFPSFSRIRSLSSTPPLSPSSPSTSSDHSFSSNRNLAAAPAQPSCGSAHIRSNTLPLDTSTIQRGQSWSQYRAHPDSWNEFVGTSGNSIDSGNEDTVHEQEDEEWGLHQGMKLFEVSAKDNSGIQDLFDHLISSIIQRRDRIEQQNDLKGKDVVFLSPVATPSWSTQADAEEAREKAELSARSRGCC